MSLPTNKILTGLTNDIPYSFRVAGVNAVGTGDYSPVVSGVPYSGGFTGHVLEYLLVAGGGGGANTGSGGGAGGVLKGMIGIIPQSTYNIIVGTGGASLPNGTAGSGSNGQNTTAFGLTAIGGGGGVTHGNTAGGSSGGSGGGGAILHPTSTASISIGGDGTIGQGNKGGNGYSQGSNWSGCSGGGGGAGQAGTDGGNSPGVGKGGDGILWYGNYYGGGGGGGEVNGSYVGSGGLGGGGNAVINAPGQNGTANTGGGGGGGSFLNGNYYAGGTGGSGIVIIRSATPASITTGSVATSTDGTINIYTFTGNGSITF
jgi:hypothetical protein